MPIYGPHDDEYTDFLEKSFLAGKFVASAGYGVQLVLYVWCVLYLQSRRKRRGKVTTYLLVYITILLCLESVFVAAGTWTVEEMYINNRNYPGGPWAYFLASQHLPENVMFFVSLFVLTFLSDLLVLWRCWVIWNSSGRPVAYAVIALPTIVLLASFALGIVWTLQSSQPGLSLYSSLPIAVGTAYYVTSLGVNILVTVLITIRLILYRQSIIMDALPQDHAVHRLSVGTIVIESAALYSAFGLCFLVSYAINNPLNQLFMALASSCQQIASYLIILRLAQGRAWDSSAPARTLTTVPQLSTVSFSIPNSSIQPGAHQGLPDMETESDYSKLA